MEVVTVSPKFQIVIPKSIRSYLGIRSGEKIAVFEKDDVIHLVRIKNIKKLKGRFGKRLTIPCGIWKRRGSI